MIPADCSEVRPDLLDFRGDNRALDTMSLRTVHHLVFKQEQTVLHLALSRPSQPSVPHNQITHADGVRTDTVNSSDNLNYASKQNGAHDAVSQLKSRWTHSSIFALSTYVNVDIGQRADRLLQAQGLTHPQPTP